jgi:hypothetical protein
MTTATKAPQDSAFYTNEAGVETVWDFDTNKRFYVVRNGEMRIHAIHQGHEVVIRYTDQLADIGIKDDAALAAWNKKGEEVFAWINNSWFEVYDANDKDYYSEPIHSLGEAIAFAKELSNKYGKELPVSDGDNGAWL